MWPVNCFSIQVNGGGHDDVYNCCKQDHDDYPCSTAPLPPQKLWVTNSTKTFTGCAMAYVVSCQPVAAVAWVWSQATSCRICGGRSGTGTDLSLSISVLHTHSISATYSSVIYKSNNIYKHRIMYLNITNITSSSSSSPPPPPPLWSSLFPLVWDGLREQLFC